MESTLNCRELSGNAVSIVIIVYAKAREAIKEEDNKELLLFLN